MHDPRIREATLLHWSNMSPTKTSVLLKYDPDRVNPYGSITSQGGCIYFRFCGGQASYMMQQQARSGKIFVGLCRKHALQKVDGDESKLPDW